MPKLVFNYLLIQCTQKILYLTKLLPDSPDVILVILGELIELTDAFEYGLQESNGFLVFELRIKETLLLARLQLDSPQHYLDRLMQFHLVTHSQL